MGQAIQTASEILLSEIFLGQRSLKQIRVPNPKGWDICFKLGWAKNIELSNIEPAIICAAQNCWANRIGRGTRPILFEQQFWDVQMIASYAKTAESTLFGRAIFELVQSGPTNRVGEAVFA